MALADRDALRQVLLNLLDNAVKYGPAGSDDHGWNARRCSDGRVQVWVDDQGTGIPARDKARVWEPFRRLDRAVEAGISGNGIGLAVVRELVDRAGRYGRGARRAGRRRELRGDAAGVARLASD